MRRGLGPGGLGLLASSCAVLFLGCGPEMTWSGTPGKTVRMGRTVSGVPVVTALAQDGSERHLILDTGHPGALLVDFEAFPESEGRERFTTELEVFGLQFHDVPVRAAQLFDHEAAGIDGILGAGIFESFALNLDYVGGWAALTRGGEEEGRPEGSETDGSSSLLMTRTGIDRSRVALFADVEGCPEAVWLDTGAIYPVAYSPLLGLLDSDPDRPRLDGLLAFTLRGPVEGYYTRIRSVAFGVDNQTVKDPGSGEEAPAPAPPTLDLTSLPVAAFPGRTDEPFDLVDQRLGLSLSSSVLERYITRIDYVGEKVTLSPHKDQGQFLQRPWLTPGFAILVDFEGWMVGRVYEGTDAAVLGVEPGDRVVSVDGQVLADLGFAELVALRNSWVEGTDVAVGLLHEGEERTLTLTLIDQLPPYGEPDVEPATP